MMLGFDHCVGFLRMLLELPKTRLSSNVIVFGKLEPFTYPAET
jgi:hypothetical protein